ncbi:uncharacterized protein B0I36DRAFT_368394 [Microdochium trichocladiopsis]|uniref:Uncharacterized protein n=1 Tax=Microdochium trichocladiopsis TaxID=1682393 RepID=A0A9P8XUJ9_9PEZI|nr:uncharacterized protein B0I36DRAFT_368394 [Microdochium trichocladiopsis]KAH7018368.1 hypothetical protein B0I36DRAFT_368394 [Microdochium trichocladiopsis]
MAPTPQHSFVEPAAASAPMTRSRKRKAESQENERLSKRLSLLKLEKDGQKLYVPVESPYLGPTTSEDNPGALPPIPEDDTMRLDDSAHKVYIYNLDDELSSSDTESICSNDDSNHRLVFLADIDKHLRQNRIPPSVFANSEGNIAGTNINDMQMVLYSDPSSLTVPEEHDSVRRAVIEARNRMRQRQKEERDGMADGASSVTSPATVPSSRIAGTPTTAGSSRLDTSAVYRSADDEMELD